MGRMKEQLGEDPATITKAQALGAIGVRVKCRPPCRRVSSIKFAALGLPRETPIDKIATLKRLVCSDCDRRATSVLVDWDAREQHSTWGMVPPG